MKLIQLDDGICMGCSETETLAFKSIQTAGSPVELFH